MSEPIQHEDLSGLAASREVLPGEIAGLRTWLHVEPAGSARSLPANAQTGRVYLFVGGGGSARLDFVAPKEPGDYGYVCTFPGHWRLMQGVMKVVAPR